MSCGRYVASSAASKAGGVRNTASIKRFFALRLPQAELPRGLMLSFPDDRHLARAWRGASARETPRQFRAARTVSGAEPLAFMLPRLSTRSRITSLDDPVDNSEFVSTIIDEVGSAPASTPAGDEGSRSGAAGGNVPTASFPLQTVPVGVASFPLPPTPETAAAPGSALRLLKGLTNGNPDRQQD